jgi:hypothetical protein
MHISQLKSLQCFRNLQLSHKGNNCVRHLTVFVSGLHYCCGNVKLQVLFKIFF